MTTTRPRSCPTSALSALLALAALSACPTEDPEGPPRERPPAEAAATMSVDTAEARFAMPLLGGDGALLEGVLADAHGRRSVVWTDGAAVEVFEADWNLPGAGAVHADGSALVCAHLLLGDAGDQLPDPAAGVVLRCRFRAADGAWASAFDLAGGARPAWLVALELRDPGFLVRYRDDTHGTLVGAPAAGDAVHEAVIEAGAVVGRTVVGELETD